MPEETLPNVLLSETPQDTLVVISLDTGEQCEYKILGKGGNFTVTIDLGLEKHPYQMKWPEAPFVDYGFVIKVESGAEITGTIRTPYNTFVSHLSYRKDYVPSRFVIDSSDEDASIRVVAVKVNGKWRPVVSSGFPVTPVEAHSE